MDHLDYLRDGDARMLAESSVVCVVCPGTTTNLRLAGEGSARALAAAGCQLAIATDYNPGTSCSENMCLMIGLACQELGLTPEEALRAATLGGARALRLQRQCGSVRLGNVLGASDSVLMRWHASARSGWIEVTDPKMTRFALTREEAVSHIVALCSRSLEGEVVVPLMRAYQLGELATAFAEEHRVAVRITGARPWEKAHATLLSEDEALIARRDGDLVVIDPRKPGGGLGVITSAGADRLSEKELANFVRMA